MNNQNKVGTIIGTRQTVWFGYVTVLLSQTEHCLSGAILLCIDHCHCGIRSPWPPVFLGGGGGTVGIISFERGELI